MHFLKNGILFCSPYPPTGQAQIDRSEIIRTSKGITQHQMYRRLKNPNGRLTLETQFIRLLISHHLSQELFVTEVFRDFTQ